MMQIKKEYVPSGIPIWMGKNIEVAQGGFTLDDSNFATENLVIPAGTPIGFDESTRTAKVAKIAVAQANAANDATELKVLKGHQLIVGMSVKSGSSASKAITAIDTTNADYDLVTVTATLAVAVTAGDAIYVSDAGYTNLKGLLYEDAIIDSNGIASISVVLRGTVYARRIVPVPTTVKATLPLIIFSQSF
jgi:hypothetical protein